MKRLFNDDQERQIAQEYADGESSYDVAVRWRCSWQTVIAIVRRLGGDVRTHADALKEHRQTLGQRRKKRTNDGEQEWVKRYAAGESAKQIADDFDVTKYTVLRGLENQGFDRRVKTRTCCLNESVFDNAENDPVAAYWCGMLMSDGCVHCREQGDSIHLGLQERDVHHVHAFRDFLGSDHAVCRQEYETSTGRSALHSINVQSNRLAEALARYGIVPRKSLIAEVKLLEMNKYFWCGMICGDGCIQFNKKGSPAVGLVGSRGNVERFVDFCHTVTRTKVRAYKRVNIWHANYTCWPAYEIIKHLFEDCPWALPRKLESAKRAMAWGQARVDMGMPIHVVRRGLDHIKTEDIETLYRQFRRWNKVADALKINHMTLLKIRRQRGIDLTRDCD